MDIRKAIDKIDVLAAANSASLTMLLSSAVLKRFHQGEHLFLDKDKVHQVFFLAEGSAALYKLNKSDEKKVIFICGEGTMLNEVILDALPASINCELLSDSWVICMDKDKFLYECERDFRLSKAVMDSMALKIRRLYHQMKNTSNTVRGDKRIAAKLWKLCRDHGVPCKRGIKIDVNLTITFLADVLGSKRETVSRQLKMLTQQKLVIVDRNTFIIPDPDKLLDYFNEP